MARKLKEFDTSNCDPEAVRKYCEIQNQIEAWLKEHPRKKLTEKEHVELRALLSKRAEALGKMLNKHVYSLFD